MCSIKSGIFLCSGRVLICPIHIDSWLQDRLHSSIFHVHAESCYKYANEHLSWKVSRIEFHEDAVGEGNCDDYTISGTCSVDIRLGEYLKLVTLSGQYSELEGLEGCCWRNGDSCSTLHYRIDRSRPAKRNISVDLRVCNSCPSEHHFRNNSECEPEDRMVGQGSISNEAAEFEVL